MPKLTRNRAVLRVRLHKVRLRVRLHKVRLSVRQCLQMSTEGCRRRVGLSRLYHGSIMYLSRHRLWVSIMYLSGVVHTNSSQGHRRHLSVPTFCRNQSAQGHRRHLSVPTFCRNQSATVGDVLSGLHRHVPVTWHR